MFNSCCTLQTALQVTKHPRSSTCVDGESVALSVVAVGAEPLHYKWKKNREDITNPECTGTTSLTLTILSFSQAHVGNYSCIISNNQNSIESEPANLALGTNMLLYNNYFSVKFFFLLFLCTCYCHFCSHHTTKITNTTTISSNYNNINTYWPTNTAWYALIET